MKSASSPKRAVSSVAKSCAMRPSQPLKFEKPAGIVTVEQQSKFFHLAIQGCPNCRSPFIDVQVSQYGSCLKAKLLCGKKHASNWDSCAGMSVFIATI